jgi:hypothetical protein
VAGGVALVGVAGGADAARPTLAGAVGAVRLRIAGIAGAVRPALAGAADGEPSAERGSELCAEGLEELPPLPASRTAVSTGSAASGAHLHNLMPPLRHIRVTIPDAA